MKTQLACLSVAAIVFASCDKSQTKANPDDTSSKKPQMEARADAPTSTEKPAPARPDSLAAKTRTPIAPPLSHPVMAESIRPAGTARDDPSWKSLTPESRIQIFQSSGIARMPKDISDKILADASKAGAPEDQVNIVTQQAAAWHHINQFTENTSGMPDHMKKSLLERLATKHGNSWMNMVPELEEQVAASIQVDQLRSKGIPGLSPDESQDLFIKAIEKYGADYKTILSVAEQSARK